MFNITVELLKQGFLPNSGLIVKGLLFMSGNLTAAIALALFVIGGAGTATTDLVSCLPPPQECTNPYRIECLASHVTSHVSFGIAIRLPLTISIVSCTTAPTLLQPLHEY